MYDVATEFGRTFIFKATFYMLTAGACLLQFPSVINEIRSYPSEITLFTKQTYMELKTSSHESCFSDPLTIQRNQIATEDLRAHHTTDDSYLACIDSMDMSQLR